MKKDGPDFLNKFSTYSNAKLLEIIDHPEEYQLEAIKAAIDVFTERKLSISEVDQAREQLIQRNDRIKLKSQSGFEKVIYQGEKLSLLFFSKIKERIFLPTGITTMVTVFLAAISIFKVIKEFEFIQEFPFDEGGDAIVFEIIYLCLAVLFVPITTLLFYRKRKLGWILALVSFIYYAFKAIVLGLMVREASFTTSILERFFIDPPVEVYMVAILLFLVCAVAICQPPIRSVFEISKGVMQFTFGIAFVCIISKCLITLFLVPIF